MNCQLQPSMLQTNFGIAQYLESEGQIIFLTVIFFFFFDNLLSNPLKVYVCYNISADTYK